MGELQEQSISCPYCGEQISVLLEPSAENQDYIEDCQVCCCPILFSVQTHAEGNVFVEVRREDE